MQVRASSCHGERFLRRFGGGGSIGRSVSSVSPPTEAGITAADVGGALCRRLRSCSRTGDEMPMDTSLEGGVVFGDVCALLEALLAEADRLPMGLGRTSPRVIPVGEGKRINLGRQACARGADTVSTSTLTASCGIAAGGACADDDSPRFGRVHSLATSCLTARRGIVAWTGHLPKAPDDTGEASSLD